MAHRQVIATRTGRYGTRMLTAGDELTLPGPAARAMIALGRAEPKREAPQADKAGDGASDLVALRAQYFEKLGRRPFNGWNADTLREKIADAD